MDSHAIRICVLDNDHASAEALTQALSHVAEPLYAVTHDTTLRAGLERLAAPACDVILLSLFLPDSAGLPTFMKVHLAAPGVPIIILAEFDEDQLAFEAVRHGAQDYLIKNRWDQASLVRTIRCAIERHRLQANLRALALVDELTGLYNRRGFITFAMQQVKLAQRNQRASLLVLADVDGLKAINDTFGHREGDLALIKTAEVLRATFRASDVLTRIGGDEFAVLAVEAQATHAATLTDRLTAHLEQCNRQQPLRAPLALSVGVSCIDPHRIRSIDEYIEEADTALYGHKRSKRANATPSLKTAS